MSLSQCLYRASASHALRLLPSFSLHNPIIALSDAAAAPSKKKYKPWDGQIPLDRVQVTYERGSGPGGMKVNTCSNRAEIRFGVQDADWMPETVRDRFFARYSHRINKHGQFIIRSHRTREANLNMADCLDKLRFSVREIEQQIQLENKQPTEAEIKKAHTQLKVANEKRLVEKKKQSMNKSSRKQAISF